MLLTKTLELCVQLGFLSLESLPHRSGLLGTFLELLLEPPQLIIEGLVLQREIVLSELILMCVHEFGLDLLA